jgi:hypothetical protein
MSKTELKFMSDMYRAQHQLGLLTKATEKKLEELPGWDWDQKETQLDWPLLLCTDPLIEMMKRQSEEGDIDKKALDHFLGNPKESEKKQAKKSSYTVMPGFKITFEKNPLPATSGSGPLARKFTKSLRSMVNKFKRLLPTPEQLRKKQKLKEGEPIDWNNAQAKVRLFSTSGGWTWYVAAFDGVYFYGKEVNPLFEAEENKAFRLTDLDDMRFNFQGIPDFQGCFGVEYDICFKSAKLMECH